MAVLGFDHKQHMSLYSSIKNLGQSEGANPIWNLHGTQVCRYVFLFAELRVYMVFFFFFDCLWRLHFVRRKIKRSNPGV